MFGSIEMKVLQCLTVIRKVTVLMKQEQDAMKEVMAREKHLKI